jgi:aspartyl-tRNA(Asn)/glutamyl-tRNA(Gln) amidotransferase subunit A
VTGESVCWLTIDELTRRYRAGELSPVEATRALLDRIGTLNGALESFLLVLEAEALRTAGESERRHRAGRPHGPLDGVPISVKDIFHVAGQPTTAASSILAGHLATEDSAVMARLRSAGAVLVGKTNLHEFAYGPTGVSMHSGTTRNPWNPAHVCGGSSSGSAAAVAAGLSFGSVGSETGASVRRPAAFCGVVGFKPTAGRISRHGMLPAAWSLDAVGVFARTVSGAATLAEALAGHDPRDPSSSRRALPGLSPPEAEIRGVRVGVPRSYLADVDDDARAAFETALENLRRLGARVEDVDLPALRFTAVASTLVAAAEITAYHRRWLRERPQDYGEDVRRRLYLGAGIGASEYLLGQRARRLIGKEVRGALARVDLLASPTAPGGAPRIDEGLVAIKDRPLEVGVHHCNLVRLPSLLGLPTVSLPCGWTGRGLPLGLQLVSRPFEEATTLIGAARAYESIAPWAERHPPW